VQRGELLHPRLQRREAVAPTAISGLANNACRHDKVLLESFGDFLTRSCAALLQCGAAKRDSQVTQTNNTKQHTRGNQRLQPTAPSNCQHRQTVNACVFANGLLFLQERRDQARARHDATSGYFRKNHKPISKASSSPPPQLSQPGDSLQIKAVRQESLGQACEGIRCRRSPVVAKDFATGERFGIQSGSSN
jgi:hypothetical protein